MSNKNNTSRQKPLGEGAIWGIALRANTGVPLYRGRRDGFVFVPNSFLYWRADPFLFERDGQTYLFAELFNRITGKGVLGVAKVKHGRVGRFKVCLKKTFHLSYPCVFELGDSVYMIPESNRDKRIVSYKCVEFPYIWKEDHTILEKPGVDTTPFLDEYGDCIGFFSTINEEGNSKNANLYWIDTNGATASLIPDDSTVRSAGHIIRESAKLIRPAQDCSDGYGKGLVFKQIENFGPSAYRETDTARVYPKDVTVKGIKKSITGIHTYNNTDRYEVIDVSFNMGITLPYLLKKTIRHFKR